MMELTQPGSARTACSDRFRGSSGVRVANVCQFDGWLG